MISIITATYNSENEILETYESIRAQTFQDWEWLVTDDCSTDNTVDILKKIESADSRVKVFESIENGGAAISRNNSLSLAKGKFIAFIDSDDLWESTKLETQMEFLQTGKNFSFTAYQTVDEDGNVLGKLIDVQSRLSFSYTDMLLKRATLGCSTVMLRRSAFGRLEMPNLRTGQDYAFWLKLLKTGERAYLVPEVLTKYRIRSNSISRNKYRKAIRQWQIYRRVEKLSLSYSCYCFMSYAIRAVFR